MELYYYKKSENHNKKDTDNLIKKSLCRSLGAGDYVIERTKNGKPYLPGKDIHVGVTHTVDIVIIGVSEFEFGMDAEPKNRKPVNRESIARKYFTKKERDMIKTDADFLMLWIKKEAYLKFSGVGISGLSSADTLNARGNFEIIEKDENYICIYSEQL